MAKSDPAIKTAYCMKCQGAKKVKNAEVELLLNGKKMLRGQCSECGTNMGKFVGAGVPHTKTQTKKEAEKNKKKREEKKVESINKLRKRRGRQPTIDETKKSKKVAKPAKAEKSTSKRRVVKRKK